MQDGSADNKPPTLGVESSALEMAETPWTDPDPQPGDFDAELDRARSDQIEIHEGNTDTELSTFVTVESEDAKHLEQIATERDQHPPARRLRATQRLS